MADGTAVARAGPRCRARIWHDSSLRAKHGETTNGEKAQDTPYDTDLDRNPANFQPLTPLGFLERAAAVFPEHTAIIHGPLQRTYAEFYARSRQLASALAKRGIGRGDTVSVMLANTPAMLEATTACR